MKKLTFSLILFCFAEMYSQSWQRIEAIPEEMVYFIFNDADTVYAGTDSEIYISRDNGESWTVLSDNSPSNLTTMIKANNILYAGTYGAGVFTSSNNGKTWNAFNNGLSSWGRLISKFHLMNNKLYLGSDGGGVYYLDLNNPTSWIEYNENLPSLVGWSIICMTGSGSNLIISAGASGFIFVRAEGSSGWKEYYVDSLKQPQVWSLLSIGDYVLAGTGRSIYRSSDNGINWDSAGIRALPLRSSTLKVYDNTVYAGLTREYDFFIWTSVDSGLSWQSLDHQFYKLIDLFVTGDKFLAATPDGLFRFYRTPVAVAHETGASDELSVYPNPFNPVTKIKFYLPERGFVRLNIFDVTGQIVSGIYNGEMRSGEHEYYFSGRKFSSGVYICTLDINGKRLSKKIVLSK